MNFLFAVVLGVVTVACAGCASGKSSNTARTGMEQLLISNAVDQSLDKVNFTPFAGRKVFVDEKYLECVDKNYVAASLRHRLLRAGAALVPTADAADVVIEPRSGGVGTDTKDVFVGIPEITLPGMLTLPEIRLLTRSSQTGTAKIGIVAIDQSTNTALGDGGYSLARADDNNWFVFGMGPYQNGSVKEEVTRGVRTGSRGAGRPLAQAVAFQSPGITVPGMDATDGSAAFQFASESKPATASP